VAQWKQQEAAPMARTNFQEKHGVHRGEPLTQRQLKILRWHARGETQAEIALRLNLNPHTVDWEIRRINGKLGTVNATHAVYIGFKKGLIG
jgi:DNA-binding CsgD family transcriptional regulator